MADKPKVLLLGGLGFIGRNMLKFLIENDMCSKIRIADKAIPETACWSDAFKQYLSNPIVERIQCNLSNPASAARAFAGDDRFNFVINLAAETRFGQIEQVYRQQCFDVSVTCANEALRHNPDKYIEVSTAHVYDSGKSPRNERAKIKPWTLQARSKVEAERAVQAIEGLPWIIVRPALVYGPGDMTGLTPRLIAGAVYTHLHEKMRFLWTSELRLNTVHVLDVCRALWHLSTQGPQHQIYNIADKNETDQGKINNLLEIIYGIETGFVGSTKSNLAKLAMKSTAAHVNDKHTTPWGEMCRARGIAHTPLSPFLDQELLYNNHLSVNGSKIEETGFTYQHPIPTPVLVKEQVDLFIAEGLFPLPDGYRLAPGLAPPASAQ